MQTLEQYNKKDIVNTSGVRYADFKESLTPDYLKAWIDLGLGLIALPAVGAIIWVVNKMYPSWFIISGIIGAVAVGYLIAYIQLFMHEAAHYNLVKNKKLNDILTNLFIGIFVGLDVKHYRCIHFNHHRHLGKTIDSESNYFDPLNMLFFLESLSGIKGLKVMMRRERTSLSTGEKKSTFNVIFLFGIIFNLSVIITLAQYHQWTLIVVWIVGLGLVFPLFNALRQLLEHRSENASPTIDYTKTPHGEINRMFGDGFFARTFGGAGFNRHLLHHWEPQISYTRLKELENYLLETPLMESLQQSKTSYSQIFLKLFNR